MSLPPDWTPLDEEKRKKLKEIVDTFEQQYQKQPLHTVDVSGITVPAVKAVVVVKAAEEAKAAVSAKPPTAVKSVDLDLLRSLRASGVPDQDLILIGAAMIANK